MIEMMRLLIRTVIITTLVLSFAVSVYSDVVHLKNGNKIEGSIVKKTDRGVFLRVLGGRGEIFIRNEEIEEIEAEEVETKAEKIAEKTETVQLVREEQDLSLELKKQIWYELIEAENRAAREAKARYPHEEELRKRVEMNKSLVKKYHKEVRDKYKITEEQELEIADEGIKNYWPQPRWEMW